MLPFCFLCQCRTDRCCELRILRYDKVDIKNRIERFKNILCLRDRREVSGEHDVVQSLIPCGEDAEHAGGLEHHVDDGERDISGGGDIGELSEIGGRHVLRQRERGFFL